MHIGLNLIFIIPGATGGLEIYASELITAMCRQARGVRFTAFTSRSADGGMDWLPDEVENVSLPVHPRTLSGWIPGELTALPRLAERAGCDLVHSLASTGPISGRFKRVTTVHDLIYRVLPQCHRGWRYLGPKWLVARLLQPWAARTSERLITDTEASAQDIVRFLKIDRQYIDVIHLGPGYGVSPVASEEPELRGKYDLGERPIALTVSAKWPHKNLARLIKALSLLSPEERPVLVVPGYPTPHEQDLKRLTARLGLKTFVKFPGWLPSADLEGLYRAAAGVILPSLYEGFGFPALEALKRGVPLACSRGGAMEELVGDAALTFDPLNVSEIAQCLYRLLKDTQQTNHLRAAGMHRAACFSWERTARQTLQSYSKALDSTFHAQMESTG